MSRRLVHPRNRWISNPLPARLLLWSCRHRISALRRIIGILLNSDIACEVPERLFFPHPYGIIIGGGVKLGEDVVIMQQVTIGGKDPRFDESTLEGVFPQIEDDVYIGAGAKILGGLRIGRGSVVGANAVVTRDVPPDSTVVGANRIVKGSRSTADRQDIK